jgi:hypothetical protein
MPTCATGNTENPAGEEILRRMRRCVRKPMPKLRRGQRVGEEVLRRLRNGTGSRR